MMIVDVKFTVTVIRKINNYAHTYTFILVSSIFDKYMNNYLVLASYT